MPEKNNCKCWVSREIGHYANECKNECTNRKNKKLIETLGSLDYFELSEEEALDVSMKNNKEIIEIILEDEYVERDYEKTSHMMECSSLSFSDLVVHNENEEVKENWALPIIQKDEIYKKFIFQLKSKYICEMMEEDLQKKECNYDVGEVSHINWGNIFKHNKGRKYSYVHDG